MPIRNPNPSTSTPAPTVATTSQSINDIFNVPLQDDEVEKRYKFGRTLGQGTFATVKLTVCLSDQSRWAVKIIKRSALTSQDEESLKMEIQILQLTNHPNIVSVKEVFYCKNYVYLIMDLMTGGELFDRIVMKDHYTELEAKKALYQIVVAIKYCHEKNIVHRDLKPENILYETPDDNSPLKLGDFGLATMLRPNQLMTVACGTPGYVAPEILRGIAYGKEVDIWSIGVILYILLCGFPPFYDDNNKKLFAQIVAANFSFPDPYWTNISQNAKDLVNKLLVVDPTKRLTAEQILQHPWMNMEDASSNNNNLTHFKSNLKSYNARRRFRGAIRAVQLTQLLKKITKNNAAKAAAAAAAEEEAAKENPTPADNDTNNTDTATTTTPAGSNTSSPIKVPPKTSIIEAVEQHSRIEANHALKTSVKSIPLENLSLNSNPKENMEFVEEGEETEDNSDDDDEEDEEKLLRTGKKSAAVGINI